MRIPVFLRIFRPCEQIILDVKKIWSTFCPFVSTVEFDLPEKLQFWNFRNFCDRPDGDHPENVLRENVVAGVQDEVYKSVCTLIRIKDAKLFSISIKFVELTGLRGNFGSKSIVSRRQSMKTLTRGLVCAPFNTLSTSTTVLTSSRLYSRSFLFSGSRTST